MMNIAFDITNSIITILIQIDIGPAFIIRIGWFIIIIHYFARCFMNVILGGIHIQRCSIRIDALGKYAQQKTIKSKINSITSIEQ